MGNKRVFFACQGLALNSQPLAGVQNVSIRTENDTHVIEDFGSFNIPEIYSDTPKSIISISKVLSTDSLPSYPINIDLTGVINKHDFKLCLFIGDDTEKFIGSGNPNNIYFNNLSLNNISYSFNIDGYFTEDLEFIGYHKAFNDTEECGNDIMDNLSTGRQPGGEQIVFTRQMLSSGFSLGEKNDQQIIKDIKINIPLNVNFIQEFGTAFNRHDKKYRYSTLPIEINCSITAHYIPSSGNKWFDNYEFSELQSLCSHVSGLPKKEDLSVSLCGGPQALTFNMNNCILKDIDYNNGGTDGSSAEMTYNYICYNGFKITTDEP